MNGTLTDWFSSVDNRGLILHLSSLPSVEGGNSATNSPKPSIVLVEEDIHIPLQNYDQIVFFHRIDKEGIEQADRALQSIDRSRLILAPFVVYPGSANEYKRVEEIMLNQMSKHPATVRIPFFPHLLVQEELVVLQRPPDHPLVESYQRLSELILHERD